MSGAERYLPAETVAGLDRLRGEAPSPILIYGPMLEIAFTTSSVRRDIQHRMGAIPTGFLPIAQEGGTVQTYDLANWTADLAFLQSDHDNTRVRGCFVITEAPIDA